MPDEEKPVVIVTGAAHGIGAAVANRLGRDGWLVVGCDLDEADRVARCDVTDPEQVAEFVAEVARTHGQIDGLINVAGAGWPTTFLDATDDLWMRTFDVNLMGTVRMCRAAIPFMKASKHRNRGIVNFTSQAAKTGGIVIGAPYSSAKAAVLCMTKSLAAEFGKDGLRVNAVAPGIIDTGFLDSMPGIRERGASVPIGRIGSVEDVAGVVAFLMSDGAAYLTGEIVDVNGGLLMD